MALSWFEGNLQVSPGQHRLDSEDSINHAANRRDRINSRLAERPIRWQMKQLVQWNEGHTYTFDRATLFKMLDDALATARP